MRRYKDLQLVPYSNDSIGMLGTLFITLVLLMGVATSPLYGQRRVAEADTGRMAWGHSDFTGYDRPTMCHRMLTEVFRQYSRIYVKDTALEPVSRMSPSAPKPPPESIEAVKKCISHMRMDESDSDQLWAVASLYMVIGEPRKSLDAANKVVATGINRSEKLQMKLLAMKMYLDYSEGYLPQAHYYYNVIRAEVPASNVAHFQTDLLMSQYYIARYEPDSILVYTNLAIEALGRMTAEEIDSVYAFQPFLAQIDIANSKGDMPLQEKILEQSIKLVSNWRGGLGQSQISAVASGIDSKKMVYNKKTNILESSMWENYDGVPRPLAGKPSLIITVNHNCSIECFYRINAIKRLKETYGDSLDLVLITSTVGFGPGTGPLSPSEEAKVAGKVFREFHKLPYPLLVDESPIYKLDDGRIVRDKSPVIQMISDINGANAIVTDADGRVKWAGNFLGSSSDLRALVYVIDRALRERIR